VANVTVKDNSKDILMKFASAKVRALEKIGLTGEGYAKKGCPVDTGNLRNSITHETDDNAAYIGTNVEYAPHVELGTIKQKAQPFLVPAATDHQNTYNAIVKSELKNG